MIGWALALPLRDVLAYPERISVLPNLQTDALTYHRIASDLSRTWSLEALPPRHPPGWVTLLAALYSVAGPSFIAGKLVSWLALLASVAGCAILARRIWSPAPGPDRAGYARLGGEPGPDRAGYARLSGEASWIAAILCASSPALRGYVGTLQYEVVTGAMLLAVLLLTDVTARSQSSRALHLRAVLAGLATGALVLTRETFLIMVPLIALWMAVRARARSCWPTAADRRRPPDPRRDAFPGGCGVSRHSDAHCDRDAVPGLAARPHLSGRRTRRHRRGQPR